MSGIKITQAIDANHCLLNVDQYNPFVFILPLSCPDKNCNAQIKYVTQHKRESYGKTQYIPAFFRLERGQVHSTTCQYATSGLDTIYAGESSHDIQTAISKGILTFRVHIFNSDDHNQIIKKTAAFQSNPPSNTTDRVYYKKGQKYPYVRTMDGLAEIYDHGLKNPTLQNKIQIIANGKAVLWSEFFYSTSQLAAFYNVLTQVKTASAAVIFRVNIATFPLKHRGNFRFIEGFPLPGALPLFPTVKLTPAIKTSIFPLSGRVMVFGTYMAPSASQMIKNNILEREIRTIVHSEEQVVVI